MLWSVLQWSVSALSLPPLRASALPFIHTPPSGTLSLTHTPNLRLLLCVSDGGNLKGCHVIIADRKKQKKERKHYCISHRFPILSKQVPDNTQFAHDKSPRYTPSRFKKQPVAIKKITRRDPKNNPSRLSISPVAMICYITQRYATGYVFLFATGCIVLFVRLDSGGMQVARGGSGEPLYLSRARLIMIAELTNS